MFGAGLPVCAVRYQCIDELVDDGRTGLLFDSPKDLAQQLLSLLRGFGGRPDGGGELNKMRAAVVRAHGGWRWHGNWQDVAAPVIAAACGGEPAAAAGAAAAAAAAAGLRAGKRE
jgi:beta-1,4-mannosyltransferase